MRHHVKQSFLSMNKEVLTTPKTSIARSLDSLQKLWPHKQQQRAGKYTTIIILFSQRKTFRCRGHKHLAVDTAPSSSKVGGTLPISTSGINHRKPPSKCRLNSGHLLARARSPLHCTSSSSTLASCASSCRRRAPCRLRHLCLWCFACRHGRSLGCGSPLRPTN